MNRLNKTSVKSILNNYSCIHLIKKDEDTGCRNYTTQKRREIFFKMGHKQLLNVMIETFETVKLLKNLSDWKADGKHITANRWIRNITMIIDDINYCVRNYNSRYSGKK